MMSRSRLGASTTASSNALDFQEEHALELLAAEADMLCLDHADKELEDLEDRAGGEHVVKVAVVEQGADHGELP